MFTDGGARGNPGPAAIGVVVYEGAKKIVSLNGYIGDFQTNNFAEYEAVALGLSELKKMNRDGSAVEIRMDSKLVVEQMRGNWKIKEPTLKPQAAKLHALLASFPHSKFVYIPREKNKEADALVNECLDAQ